MREVLGFGSRLRLLRQWWQEGLSHFQDLGHKGSMHPQSAGGDIMQVLGQLPPKRRHNASRESSRAPPNPTSVVEALLTGDMFDYFVPTSNMQRLVGLKEGGFVSQGVQLSGHQPAEF